MAESTKKAYVVEMAVTFRKCVIVYGESEDTAEREAVTFADNGGLDSAIWEKGETEARCVGRAHVEDWQNIKEHVGL